jgi:hypothetical protein
MGALIPAPPISASHIDRMIAQWEDDASTPALDRVWTAGYDRRHKVDWRPCGNGAGERWR